MENTNNAGRLTMTDFEIGNNSEVIFWKRRFDKQWKLIFDWNENAGLINFWIKDPDTNEVVFRFGDIRVGEVRRNHGCYDFALSDPRWSQKPQTREPDVTYRDGTSKVMCVCTTQLVNNDIRYECYRVAIDAVAIPLERKPDFTVSGLELSTIMRQKIAGKER